MPDPAERLRERLRADFSRAFQRSLYPSRPSSDDLATVVLAALAAHINEGLGEHLRTVPDYAVEAERTIFLGVVTRLGLPSPEPGA